MQSFGISSLGTRCIDRFCRGRTARMVRRIRARRRPPRPNRDSSCRRRVRAPEFPRRFRAPSKEAHEPEWRRCESACSSARRSRTESCIAVRLAPRPLRVAEGLATRGGSLALHANSIHSRRHMPPWSWSQYNSFSARGKEWISDCEQCSSRNSFR